MIPLIRSLFHVLLWDAVAVRQRLRAFVGVLALSGATYAERLAGEFNSPGLAKYVRAVAFICGILVAAAGDKREETSSPTSRSAAGFARLGVLLVLALVGLGTACATHSESAGTLRVDTSSHGDEATKVDGKSTQAEEGKEHSEDRGTAKTDEANAEIQTGGAVDLHVTTKKPDGTVTTKDYHRDPIEKRSGSTKSAAVQAALTKDASSVFGAELDTHAEGTKKTDATGTSVGTHSNEHDAKAQVFSCAGGATFGLALLVGLGFLVWRRIRKTKLAKAAAAAIALVSAIALLVSPASAATRDPVADAVAIKPIAGSLPFPVTAGAASSTLEAPACGQSPCPVTAASTLILSPNPTRHALRVRNVGTVDLACCLGSTCTSTAFSFILAASTKETLKLEGLTMWGGSFSCAGAAGGSLAVMAF